MKSNDRYDMTVTMSVTIAQGLALKAMFDYWNRLSSMGSSRRVAFYVDGDGNFHPKCRVEGIDVSDEYAAIAIIEDDDGHRVYDFDPIGWALNDKE